MKRPGNVWRTNCPWSRQEKSPPAPGVKKKRVMTMYVVTKGPEGVVQASMPICQVIGTLIRGPKVTFWAPSKWSGLSESSQGGEHLKPEPIQLMTKAA